MRSDCEIIVQTKPASVLVNPQKEASVVEMYHVGQCKDTV